MNGADRAMAGAPWLSSSDLCARIERDFAGGLPALLRQGDRVWIALSAETLDEADWARATGSLGRDGWTLAITARRAATLKARAYDGDIARLRLESGVSADALRAIADPARALDRPLLGPHLSKRDDDHAARATARAGIALLKRARLLPAALLKEIAADDVEALRAEGVAELESAIVFEQESVPWRAVATARVPIDGAPSGRMTLFRQADRPIEHIAYEIGDASDPRPPLVRLHSACATGDIFGSLKCDCGPQLRGALLQMASAERGLLIYLNQEGRGIGLANKLRAYRLQDQGFDTVEANHRLGFQDDERTLTDGAEILVALGVTRARLLTNNPAKVDALASHGVDVVERVPLQVGRTAENDQYLAVKAAKSGHIL